jgi:hypothetical protein
VKARARLRRRKDAQFSKQFLHFSASGCFLFESINFPREPMQFHFSDFVTAANLLVLLGIYRKLSIIVYQHKLMWTDFADRKGISANGKHAAAS